MKTNIRLLFPFILFFGLVPILFGKNIQIGLFSASDFKKFDTLTIKEDDSLILSLGNFSDFNSNLMSKAIQTGILPRTVKIIMIDQKPNTGKLKTFFLIANMPNLHELEFIRINKKFDFIPWKKYSNKITSLKIVDASIKESFFKLLTRANFPMLQHLTLRNAKLKAKWFHDPHALDIVAQLKSLDLSNNPIGNSILNIFLRNEPGQLETLKLNDCDLSLKTTTNNYSKKYPALDQIFARSSVFVDWNSPLFDNLTNLEMINMCQIYQLVTNYYSIQKFRNLKHFIGFKYVPNKRKKDEIIKSYNFFQKYYFQIPLKCSECNVPLTSLNATSYAIKSPQAPYLESIELAGHSWNVRTIEYFLEQQYFPKLKNIKLTQVDITPQQLLYLIAKYTTISFDAELPYNLTQKKFNDSPWPIIYKK